MIPSVSEIARQRHWVRVLVRLAAAPLLLVGVILLIRAVLRTAIMMMEGGSFTILYLAYSNITPVLVSATGAGLIIFDKRLAKLIVPMPSRGCPECGYFIGRRDVGACPECGLSLRAS